MVSAFGLINTGAVIAHLVPPKECINTVYGISNWYG